MGSGPKPKPKGRPAAVHSGPDQIAEPDPEGPETLEIWLINVRESTHAGASVGDTVAAPPGRRPLVAVVAGGVLGGIPSQYISSVENDGYQTGHVTSLGLSPPSAVITLAR